MTQSRSSSKSRKFRKIRKTQQVSRTTTGTVDEKKRHPPYPKQLQRRCSGNENKKWGQIYFLRPARRSASPATLSLVPPTGFALHGESLSLVWPRESNQREGHPGIRVWPAARLPSLRRCSGGRLTRAILGPLSLSPHPCGSSPYATPPLGLLTGNGVRASSLEVTRGKGFAVFHPTSGNVEASAVWAVEMS